MFVVDKSEVRFTTLFTDKALEQEIKDLKRHGEIVGLSQDDSGLDRLGPQLTRMVKQYISGFPRFSQISAVWRFWCKQSDKYSETSSLHSKALWWPL